MATTTPVDLSTFPYGWREVTEIADDGAVIATRVPLTLEEALAPQEGDVVPESVYHERWRSYLYTVCRARLVVDPTMAVLSDQRVDWGPAGIPAYSPDVAVMAGVRAQRNWRTFDIVAEGAEPVLVIEITSLTTAEADRTTKPLAYAKARVAQYIVIDGLGERGRPPVELLAYRLGTTGMEPEALDQRGWVWLPAVRVWLGLERGEWPRCYTETGEPIPDYPEQAVQLTEQAAQITEQAARLTEQAARLSEQEARLSQQEARIAALEAELRRLRGDQ